MKRRRFLAAGVAALATRATDAAAEAEPPFPSRPMRLVVPQAAGGSADLLARMGATYEPEKM